MLLVRRRGADAILNVAALCVVVAGMAAINDDVRRYVVNVLSGDPDGQLAMIASSADHLVRIAFKTIGAYQASHGILLGFGVAALVLVGFMFRT